MSSGYNAVLSLPQEPAPTPRLLGMPRLLKLDFDVPGDELPRAGELQVAEMTIHDTDVTSDTYDMSMEGDEN